MGNLHYQCKLCNLIKRDKDLFIEIHNRVLGPDPIAKTVVCKWLNNTIKSKNIDRSEDDQLPTFNNANFTKHFKNHIPSEDKFKFELRRYFSSSIDRASTSFDESQQTIANAFMSGKSNTDKHEFLSSMADHIEIRIQEYKNYYDSQASNQTINRRPNLREVKEVQKLITDAIHVRQEIIKLKNSERVMELAVRTAVEEISVAVLEKLIVHLDEIKPTLESEIPGSNLVTKLLDGVKLKMTNDIKLMTSEILFKTTKDSST